MIMNFKTKIDVGCLWCGFMPTGVAQLTNSWKHLTVSPFHSLNCL